MAASSVGEKAQPIYPQDCCWTIPLAAMCAAFLFSMAQSSTGYLYVLFMDKFGINRELASWPESIILLTQNLGGFLVTVLQTKIPVYYVAVLSAFLSVIGLVGAAFSPNIQWMSVALGGIYGTGCGASIISYTVYTMLYFDKYRATATAFKYIGWAGSGLAGPLVFSVLADHYGLGGSLLIGAGITFHAVPIAMTLRRPQQLRCKAVKRCFRNKAIKHIEHRVEEEGRITTGGGSQTEAQVMSQKGSPTEMQPEFKTFGSDWCTCKKETSAVRPTPVTHNQSSDVSFAGGGFPYMSSGTNDNKIVLNIAPPSHVHMARRQPRSDQETRDSLRQLTIFCEPAFYVLLVVYAFCDCAISMHTTTVVDYGMDKGSPLDRAKLVLTYNAAGQFAGRTLLPLASDNVSHSRCPFAVVCFACAGACLLAMSAMESFLAFVALNMLIGVSGGFVTCIRSVLVNDYLGVDRLPTFFGILGLALVPLSLSGPTVIGFFRDTLGSYNNFYRMLGAMNLCIGVLLVTLVLWDKRRRKTFDLAPAVIREKD